MPNILLKKSIEEPMNHPENATNGIVNGYTGTSGFTDFKCPGYLTIDIGNICKVACIRFLLWDGLGKNVEIPDSRRYCYRLLISNDRKSWQVLFDTGIQGYNGWQVFNFPEKIEARFIRLHGINNTANESFHVVQIEAYDDSPSLLNRPAVVERSIYLHENIIETGDALPLETKIFSIVAKLNKIIGENLFKPDLFNDIIGQLTLQARDIGNLERSIDSIRREITDPVRIELEKSSKLGKYSVYGFWVGIIGGILAIFSLIVTLF